MKQPTCPNQSIPQLYQTSRLTKGFRFASSLALALLFVFVAPLRAADVTWTNGNGTSLWNLTDLNWNTGVWNNANGDGAIFDATGAGPINITSPINVDSLDLMASGYSFNGTGPLIFVDGTSTLSSGPTSPRINVDTHFNVTINTPINSSVGPAKVGGGTLYLAGPMTFSGIGFPATPGNNLIPVDLSVGGLGLSNFPGGTLVVTNTGVLPSTTRLGLGNGLVDLGPNSVTLGSVTFTNDLDTTPFNPATGSAGVGIIGTGTLTVTGEINVLSSPGSFNAGSNSIATNLDFGGGTQIIRTAGVPLVSLQGALQLTGVLSNGSLLKTYGFNPFGMMVVADGMGLFGNNTYTGSTVINGGFNAVTGTNASTFVEVAGAGTLYQLSLQGANGSYLSAPTVLAAGGGTLTLDNNASLGGAGSTGPTIPAAQNNNRLADNVDLQLRDGAFTYRGLANTAATETIGQLSILGGHNIITLATSGTGTAVVTVAGDFTMAPRSSVAFNTTTLGGTTQLFVNGAVPAADPTFILPRVVTATDFVRYNVGTGFTPYTGYATDFTTPGTNVSVTAATPVNSSVNINALKRGTTSFAITLGASVTLGVNSGMILSTGGTGTYTGGTIAFGSTPGAFFGTNTVSSAITGSAGLLNNGTLTLNGDLSGLTGTLTQNGTAQAGQTTLATNTFGGPIELRAGFMNINVSLAGGGAITIGTSANESNIVPAIPQFSISGAGASAIIARDIIVSNGGQNSAGVRYGNGLIPLLGVLSNTTGSQTVSGNITLNSPLRLQGGGGGGTGATNFPGNVQGSSYLRVINGRAVFSGNLSNAGGFFLGEQGNTTRVTFNGTITGVAPLVLNGGINQVSYTSGALPTGTISTNNVDAPSVPFLIPLDSSTINNPFSLTGNVFLNGVFGGGSVGADVGAGISANWAGPMSGLGGLVKNGVGILTLSNASNPSPIPRRLTPEPCW